MVHPLVQGGEEIDAAKVHLSRLELGQFLRANLSDGAVHLFV